MAIDFPNTPTVGQQFIAAGIAWSWDGSKWVNATNVPSGYAPLNSPPFTGNPTAPTPPYGDNDTSLATTAFVQSAVAPALNNVGRNLIHNPLFNVAQRGTAFTVSANYTADRWQMLFSGGAYSVSIVTLPDAVRTAIGDEAAAVCLQGTFTGTAGANDFDIILQPVEGVRRLSGKTVTLSFWATASTTLKVGVELVQHFGSGGAPSADVSIPVQAVTLSNSWTRYSVTAALPATSGKTLGTANNDFTGLYLWFSTGSANATRASGIGVQSGTIQLWGVQFEVGSVATPLEKPDPQQDLAKCQRFYEVCSAVWVGDATNGVTYGMSVPFSVEKRASPTITSLTQTGTANGGFNARSGSAGLIPTRACSWTGSVNAATGPGKGFSDTFSASADL